MSALKCKIQKASGTKVISSFRQFIETLKKNNKKLSDTTVVFCNPDLKVDEETRCKALKIANTESEN